MGFLWFFFRVLTRGGFSVGAEVTVILLGAVLMWYLEPQGAGAGGVGENPSEGPRTPLYPKGSLQEVVQAATPKRPSFPQMCHWQHTQCVPRGWSAGFGAGFAFSSCQAPSPSPRRSTPPPAVCHRAASPWWTADRGGGVGRTFVWAWG